MQFLFILIPISMCSHTRSLIHTSALWHHCKIWICRARLNGHYVHFYCPWSHGSHDVMTTSCNVQIQISQFELKQRKHTAFENSKYHKILQKNVATHKECKRTVWTSTQEAERWITLWIYIKIVCLLDRRCKSGSGRIIVLLKLLVFYVALLLNRRLGPVLGVHCTHAVRSCLKVPWLGRASWVHCNMWGLSCGTHALRSL